MASFIVSAGKKLAIAATLAIGIAGSAQAGSLSGEIIIHAGGHGGGYHGEYYGGGWHGGHDRWRGGPECRPREAVDKAWRQGMRRPGIERVGRRQIVVSGWFRGHRAVLVFDRYSPRCRIIGSRGI